MAPSDLQEFLNAEVYSFILTFVRLGAAFLLMPGLGDAFIPTRIRLLLALGMTLVLYPFVGPNLPDPEPEVLEIFTYISAEFVIGLFIGFSARVFQTALDMGGQFISLIAGLRGAELFSPSLGGQGSVIGGFLGVTGIALFMAANLHHLMILGILNSYEIFPFGEMPASGGLADVTSRFVTQSFMLGFQIAAPVIVVGLVIHMISGIIARIIPQIQAFILVLPLQILVSIITLAFITSTIFIFWLNQFESSLTFLFSGEVYGQ